MCSVVVPELRKPCRRPAGTISAWPAVTIVRSLVHPHLGLALAHRQHFLDGCEWVGAPWPGAIHCSKMHNCAAPLAPRRPCGFRRRPPLFRRVSRGSMMFMRCPFRLSQSALRRADAAHSRQRSRRHHTRERPMTPSPSQSRPRHGRRARHRACDRQTLSRRRLAGGAARYRGRIAERKRSRRWPIPTIRWRCIATSPTPRRWRRRSTRSTSASAGSMRWSTMPASRCSRRSWKHPTPTGAGCWKSTSPDRSCAPRPPRP